jgi:hypothetical protein
VSWKKSSLESFGYVQGTYDFLGRNSATGLDGVVIDDRQGLDPDE